MTKETIKKYILEKLHEGNVKANITKLDTHDRYDTVCGVWVNGELEDVFELKNINNKEIDEFLKEIKVYLDKNTLYLI